jgi:hypothetical protein
MRTILALAAALGIWRDGRVSAARRFEHTLVAGALLSFVLVASYWHLMPPGLSR